MKLYQLDKSEEEILKAFEEGKLAKVKDFNLQKKILEKAAKNSSNKTKNINIRISERVLQKLKVKAAKEGIPYQTKISSILHQSVD